MIFLSLKTNSCNSKSVKSNKEGLDTFRYSSHFTVGEKKKKGRLTVKLFGVNNEYRLLRNKLAWIWP